MSTTTFQFHNLGPRKISFYGATPVTIDELGIQFGGIFIIGALMNFVGWPVSWKSWWV